MLSSRRLILMTASTIMAMLAVLLRMAQLQVFGADYAHRSLSQQLETRELEAPRGTIFDRDGNVLAVSTRAYNLRVDVDAITDTTQLAEVLALPLQQPMPDVRIKIEDIISDSHGRRLRRIPHCSIRK